MNAYVAMLRSRFDQLEKREQTALVLLSAFLGAVFLYVVVWSSIVDYVASSEADYDRHAKLFHYLQSTEAQARAVSGTKPPSASSGQSLLTSVSRTAQTVGIKPSRMQPEGGDAVSVWFDAVSFSSLMVWLERLESNQGIVVRQITLDRRDESGQVSARLVLRD
jgi:general secretion pathway protein M